MLNKAEDILSRFEANTKLREVYYLKAIIYNQLGELKLRNEFSRKFRNCNSLEQKPSNQSVYYLQNVDVMNEFHLC
jgi:hypothetical protein